MSEWEGVAKGDGKDDSQTYSRSQWFFLFAMVVFMGIGVIWSLSHIIGFFMFVAHIPERIEFLERFAHQHYEFCWVDYGADAEIARHCEDGIEQVSLDDLSQEFLRIDMGL